FPFSLRYYNNNIIADSERSHSRWTCPEQDCTTKGRCCRYERCNRTRLASFPSYVTRSAEYATAIRVPREKVTCERILQIQDLKARRAVVFQHLLGLRR